MSRLRRLLTLAVRQGAYVTDSSALDGEELIASFGRLGVPFIGAWWGSHARFLSVGHNSTIGVAVPPGKLTAKWFAASMLDGDGLDQFLLYQAGERDIELKAEPLSILASAMRGAVKRKRRR
jgi:hypothetical protein